MPALKNSKHERFCGEYIVDLNGRQAAIRTGYAGSNAEFQASRLLARADVKARVAELQAERAQRLDVTADDVVRRLKLLGFSNMGDYVRVVGDGNVVLDFSRIDRDKWAAVSELVVDEFTEGGGEDARDVRRIRFKLHDPRAPLVHLGKHLGLWPNKAADRIADSLEKLVLDSIPKEDGDG